MSTVDSRPGCARDGRSDGVERHEKRKPPAMSLEASWSDCAIQVGLGGRVPVSVELAQHHLSLLVVTRLIVLRFEL